MILFAYWLPSTTLVSGCSSTWVLDHKYSDTRCVAVFLFCFLILSYVVVTLRPGRTARSRWLAVFHENIKPIFEAPDIFPSEYKTIFYILYIFQTENKSSAVPCSLFHYHIIRLKTPLLTCNTLRFAGWVSTKSSLVPIFCWILLNGISSIYPKNIFRPEFPKRNYRTLSWFLSERIPWHDIP